jgi:hypothetical protein
MLPSAVLTQLSGITGEWEDAYGTQITISSSVYVSIYPGYQPSIIHITHYDDEAGFFVGQNSGEGSYNPGLWSRVDWVEDAEGGLHLCTTHYSAATEEEAMAYPDDDAFSHAAYLTTGCGGFAFSSLTPPPTPPLLIAGGDWTDSWGTVVTVSSTAYISTYPGTSPCVQHITHYDNAEGFLVGRNEGAGCYYEGNWSRIDWVIDTDDNLHVCTSQYNAPSEEAAMDAVEAHDHSLYASTGCGGFAFSALTPLAPRASLEPSGWTDDWGTEITLGYDAYVSIYPGYQPSIVHITLWNESETFFVGQNMGPGSYYPGLYSRVDWVKDAEGALHLCTTHYAAATEADALVYPTDSASYDKGNLTHGCGGFGFSSLSPPPEAPLAIAGEWVDSYGTDLTVSSSAYVSIYSGAQPSVVHVTYYDNLAGYLIGQNYGPGSYYPGLWSRVDWVVDTDDSLHVCTTHYAAPNATAAMVAHAEHDHALYASTGCGGYPFSALTAKTFPAMPDCPSGCVPAAARRARRALLFSSLPAVECPMGCVAERR